VPAYFFDSSALVKFYVNETGIRSSGKLTCEGGAMNSKKAYDEVADFIAANNPRGVIAFRASAQSRSRVAHLILREKTTGLSADEKSELGCCILAEHLMRLAKASAHSYLSTR
jgi:hypothetical protein